MSDVLGIPTDAVVKSRTEEARDLLLQEFAKIVRANGYRNEVVRVIGSIRPMDKITEFPEIGLEFGVSKVIGDNDISTVFDKIIEVFVCANVECDTDADEDNQNLTNAMLSMEHDLEKMVASLMTKYINTSGQRFNVVKEPFEINHDMVLGNKRNKGVVYTKFNIRLRSMDGANFF